jgi:arylsulfatase A-like enzyme
MTSRRRSSLSNLGECAVHLLISLVVMPCAHSAARDTDARRPNLVWFVVDDMSPNFSCYGESAIETPNIDRLAREGTLFRSAFSTAPVCSASRSALITGMYQTSIGAHNHQSGRGAFKIHLPSGVEPIPAILKRHGYYVAIGGPLATGTSLGKTDYNFEWDRSIYDGNDWAGRRVGQPFFMQVQLHGGKYREGKNWAELSARELGTPTDPAKVKLPPHYPRDAILINDWANYLDAVRLTDKQVGEVIRRLETEHILDQTIVVFTTDHGISHARGKQFLYDEGTHVPLIIRGPGIAGGTERRDLVEHIDIAPTSLGRVGFAIPGIIQGRDVLSPTYAPRDAVFAARDRCDETVERIRSVRTERFKYIRNDYPRRPHLQPNRYKDAKRIVQRLRELHKLGELDPLQERLLFSPTRPMEELYDLLSDPFELRNLADDPAARSTLLALRGRVQRWIIDTGDQGQTPESQSRYESEMQEHLNGRDSRQTKALRDNIELMKKWAAEGK